MEKKEGKKRGSFLKKKVTSYAIIVISYYNIPIFPRLVHSFY